MREQEGEPPVPSARVVSPLAAASLVFQDSGQLELDNESGMLYVPCC